MMMVTVKVIPQKKKFLINFFETFPECSPPSIVSKKTIKMIGHHSRKRRLERVFSVAIVWLKR